MTKYEKVIRNGEVAILVSPGFGAGWSTWASDEDGLSEFCVFDAGLIKLVEENAQAEDAENYLKSKFGEDLYIYMGGWSDVEIRWLDEGTKFYIHEYDGSESIKSDADLILTA